eukprot:g25076.t1
MPLWCASADLVIRGLALLGSVCTLLILFGRFGEVKRSKKTCYPIPAQVVHQLRCAPEAARPQLPARNIAGPPGHTLGTGGKMLDRRWKQRELGERSGLDMHV